MVQRYRSRKPGLMDAASEAMAAAGSQYMGNNVNGNVTGPGWNVTPEMSSPPSWMTQKPMAGAYDYAPVQNRPMPSNASAMEMAGAAAGMGGYGPALSTPLRKPSWLDGLGEAGNPNWGNAMQAAPSRASDEEWLNGLGEKGKPGWDKMAKAKPAPTRLSPGMYRGADGKIRKPKGGKF